MNVAGIDHPLTRCPHSEAMRLLLIPVASSLPAVRDHLGRFDESRPLTPAERAELSRLLVGVVAASEALLDYARRVAGRPGRN